MDSTYEQLAERNAVLEAEKAALSEENAALAAHLEALFETWTGIVDEGACYSPVELEDAMRAVFSDGPPASLGRLIAEKQREAYRAGWDASGEGSNGEYPGDAHESPGWIAERDEWIRHQSEEASHD